MMKSEKSETTVIRYNRYTNDFCCVKCGYVMEYNFGLSKCPKCHRKVSKSEKRQ